MNHHIRMLHMLLHALILMLSLLMLLLIVHLHIVSIGRLAIALFLAFLVILTRAFALEVFAASIGSLVFVFLRLGLGILFCCTTHFVILSLSLCGFLILLRFTFVSAVGCFVIFSSVCLRLFRWVLGRSRLVRVPVIC